MKIRKLTPAGAVLAAVVLGVSLALAPAAFAGKTGGSHGGGGGGHGGSGGGSGSLTLQMYNDMNGNGAPNWGDTITFTVSTTATTEPHVGVTCTQGGTVVYSASTGYYASYPWPWTQNMTLSSQMWTGGSASCTATLQAYSGTSVSTLGTLNFTVAA
jgi:hypothetical protein